MEKASLKRQFIYYFGTFTIVSLLVIGIAIYNQITAETPFLESMQQLWFMPILVLGLQFAYESILGALSKKTLPNKSEEGYVQHISMVARQLLNLTMSDFEVLKDNQVFQLALSEAYQRYKAKNKKESDYQLFLEWFEEDTLEHNVVELTIKETLFLINKETE
jgi:hypothetical protein